MSNILKYQNPSSPLLIQQVNQSGANFVKRLLDSNRKSIPDWETKGTKIATHKLGWAEDNQGAYVYPEVQEINGQLIDFSRPPYAPGIADYLARKNNNIVRMSPEEADWFTRNYKQYYPSFKKGGNIHIKKKNRGKFTESAKRAGMGVQEFARHILANKDKYSPTLVKRANFARNSKKFKHQGGGIVKYQNPAKTLDLPDGFTYGEKTEPVVIKVGNNNNFPLYSDMFQFTPEQEFIDKAKPTVPYLPLLYDRYDWKTKQYVKVPIDSSDIHDITDDIRDGDSHWYDSSVSDAYSFFKDKNTNRIYRVWVSPDKLHGTINEDNFEQIDHDYIKTLLPKRDYIGGTKKDVALKIIDKVPNLRDTILSLASKYGISADLFAQRIGNEGWLQQIARRYNTSSAADQKTFAWQDYMDNEVDGFESLGLDTFGNLHKEGKLNLRRNIDYVDNYITNEDGTERKYNSAIFQNAYDALEAKAAMFEYFTKIAKQRNIPEEDLNAYVNAMYNMGPYHKDLNNMDYVRRTYQVTPYFKLGGILKAQGGSGQSFWPTLETSLQKTGLVPKETHINIPMYTYWDGQTSLEVPLEEAERAFGFYRDVMPSEAIPSAEELQNIASKKIIFSDKDNWKDHVNDDDVKSLFSIISDDTQKFISSLPIHKNNYVKGDADLSDTINITAPNTDISKFIFGNKISKDAIKEISRVAKLRNQDPYDILAHMLIENSGSNPLTTHSYYNTHDVVRRQINPSLYNNYTDPDTILKQLGIYNGKNIPNINTIKRAYEKVQNKRNEAVKNLKVPESSIDAVALRMLLHGRDFNPAQKGLKVMFEGEVKNTYLDMIDSAIKSLKENMPDLFIVKKSAY